MCAGPLRRQYVIFVLTKGTQKAGRQSSEHIKIMSTGHMIKRVSLLLPVVFVEDLLCALQLTHLYLSMWINYILFIIDRNLIPALSRLRTRLAVTLPRL